MYACENNMFLRRCLENKRSWLKVNQHQMYDLRECFHFVSRLESIALDPEKMTTPCGLLHFNFFTFTSLVHRFSFLPECKFVSFKSSSSMSIVKMLCCF